MEKIYDLINKGAFAYGNLLTKSYNWTFGGTKLDLANELLTIAPILETIGFMNAGPIYGALFTPLYLLISHTNQINNKNRYEREIKALEKNSLDLNAERIKRLDLPMALMWGSVSLLNVIPTHQKGYFTDDRDQTNLIKATGHFLRGSSFLVMLADNLPPRKNCVSRGIEKLAEFTNSYTPKTQIA